MTKQSLIFLILLAGFARPSQSPHRIGYLVVGTIKVVKGRCLEMPLGAKSPKPLSAHGAPTEVRSGDRLLVETGYVEVLSDGKPHFYWPSRKWQTVTRKWDVSDAAAQSDLRKRLPAAAAPRGAGALDFPLRGAIPTSAFEIAPHKGARLAQLVEVWNGPRMVYKGDLRSAGKKTWTFGKAALTIKVGGTSYHVRLQGGEEDQEFRAELAECDKLTGRQRRLALAEIYLNHGLINFAAFEIGKLKNMSFDPEMSKIAPVQPPKSLTASS